MANLDHKVAIITGGSRGIGAAIAKRLAEDGARVAITYAKDASAASAVVKTIESAGGKAVAFQADATIGREERRRNGCFSFRPTRRAGEQRRNGHPEEVRGNRAGRDGSHDQHQHSWPINTPHKQR